MECGGCGAEFAAEALPFASDVCAVCIGIERSVASQTARDVREASDLAAWYAHAMLSQAMRGGYI